MGCCLTCCCKENKTQDDDPDVHTHLLSDPVSNSSSIQRVHSDDLSAQYPNSLPKKTDEQSVLNKILQATVQNVIDVAALGSHNIEQNEYLERRSQYSTKLNHLVNTAWQPGIKVHGLLTDIPMPEKVLAAPPLSDDDYILIKRASSRFKSALSELKVNHTEDLIVPFHIGTI